MKKKTLVLAALALTVSLVAEAQQFQSTHLENAAKKLRLDSVALATETLPSTKIITQGGRKIAVRKDASGVVEHIGVPLFVEEMRLLKPSPIYDYLEYTVLDRLFKVNANTLTHQDLRFEKGDLSSLANVLEKADGCNIENVGEKYYRVKWTSNNTPVIVVSFPIDYELLANSNRKEMELNFIRDLKHYTDTMPIVPKDYSTKMVPTSNPDVFVVPGNSYIIDAINSNRYLTFSTQKTKKGKTRSLQLLFDRHQPQESLANILLEHDMVVDGARVALEFVLGNYKRDTVTVALRDWTSFCLKQGCKPYFGFEENDKGTLTGTVVMSNKQSGYDHIMAVKTSEDELFAEHPLIHAKVYLFTPSTNVRNLFGTDAGTNKLRIR